MKLTFCELRSSVIRCIYSNQHSFEINLIWYKIYPILVYIMMGEWILTAVNSFHPFKLSPSRTFSLWFSESQTKYQWISPWRCQLLLMMQCTLHCHKRINDEHHAQVRVHSVNKISECVRNAHAAGISIKMVMPAKMNVPSILQVSLRRKHVRQLSSFLVRTQNRIEIRMWNGNSI